MSGEFITMTTALAIETLRASKLIVMSGNQNNYHNLRQF